MSIVFWIAAILLAEPFAVGSPPPTAQASAAPTLDFEFFKAQVQPIFLAKRPGFTRCVVCHSGEGVARFLEPLAPGTTAWTDEQAKQNFARVSVLVTPGDPMKSRLLRHPLEPSAGGDEFHNGGRQFASQDDPQFKTLAAWVKGQTGAGAAR